MDAFMRQVGENAPLSIEERDIAVALLKVVSVAAQIDT
jgi:hypothetical protein